MPSFKLKKTVNYECVYGTMNASSNSLITARARKFSIISSTTVSVNKFQTLMISTKRVVKAYRKQKKNAVIGSSKIA